MGPVRPPVFADLGFTGDVLRGTITGIAASTAAAAVRGGRIRAQQIAVDAFGNALGQSLASASNGTQTAHTEDPLGEFINENLPRWEQRQANYDTIVGAFSNPGAVNRAEDLSVAAGHGYDMGKSARDPDRFRAENLGRLRDLARRADPGCFEYYRQADGVVRVQVTMTDGETPAASGTLTPPSAPGIEVGYFNDDGDAWLAPITVRAAPQPAASIQALGNQESAIRDVVGGMDERLNALVQDAQDRYVQDGARSSGWRYGLNAAGYVASEFFPRSVGQAAFDAVGGPVIGRVVGAGVAQINKLPILGSNLPQLGRSVSGWFSPGVGPSATRVTSPVAQLRAVNTSNLTRPEKGVLGEARATLTFERAGYQHLSSKLPSNNGFDGVFIKKAPDGALIDIIINESKFTSTGRASLPNTNMGKQMSPEWIDANIRKMLVSDDSAVRATGRLLRNNSELIRTKANVLDRLGINRWNVLNLPE